MVGSAVTRLLLASHLYIIMLQELVSSWPSGLALGLCVSFMRHTCTMTSQLMNFAPWRKFATITSLQLQDERQFVSLVRNSEEVLALPWSPMNQPLLFPAWAGEMKGPPAEF